MWRGPQFVYFLRRAAQRFKTYMEQHAIQDALSVTVTFMQLFADI